MRASRHGKTATAPAELDRWLVTGKIALSDIAPSPWVATGRASTASHRCLYLVKGRSSRPMDRDMLPGAEDAEEYI